MLSSITPRQKANAELFRDNQAIVVPRLAMPVASGLGLRGLFVVEHWRGNDRFNEYHFRNDITNEGRNKLLNVMFDAGTQVTTWYLGIINNVGFTALANNDIYDDIDQAGNGWGEFKSYTDANNSDSTTTRPVWQTDPAASQSISNTTTSIYDITGIGIVKGLFTVGGGTSPELKGDHIVGSTLWATALFTIGDVPVQIGDQLKVTYTVSA